MDSDPYAIPGTSKDAIKGDLSSGAIGTGSSHAAGGIKSSFHGYIYQVKLAMFFIVRALVQNFVFDIGTEVDTAESFDDLVFEYENETEKRVIFLQAKHRLDEVKTINEIDLINEDGHITPTNNMRKHHFSLRKHYFSYCKIFGAKMFKETLKQAKVTFVLCTNIGIDNSIQKEFEEVKDGEFAFNGFLHPGTTTASAKFYKIISDTPFYDRLVSLLGKEVMPSTLAQLLAKSVVNNKKKSIKIDDQFKRYRECLLDNIFNHGTELVRKQNSYYVSFKENFLFNNDLPEHLLKFREEFIQSFIIERNTLNDAYVTDKTIQKELFEVKFTVPKDFIKGGASNQNRAKDFLNALIFAVNQPSEDKLGDIVEKEVGEYAGLIDRKYVACKFQTYILNWVKQKEGRFLKKVDVEEQFAVWGQTDQSHRNVNEVKSLDYAFEQDDVIVNVTNFLKDDSGRVICLYYREQLLSEIKLCQTLTYDGDKNNEFIYSDVCTLSEQVNTKKCPIKAFNTQSCNNVYVKIKKKTEVNQKEEMLLRRLFDVVKRDIRNGKKAGKAIKRILMLIPLKHDTVNERNDFFQNIDSEGIQRIILEDAEVKFSNLNDDSRRKLFEKGLHKVVGDEIGRTVIDTFDDFTLQSIWNAVRHSIKYQDRSIEQHVDQWKEKLSRVIRDDVLSGWISGDSNVYEDLNRNYNNMTQFWSDRIDNDVLSTIMTESTRTDTTFEEKAYSFLLNGVSIITPLIEEYHKNK